MSCGSRSGTLDGVHVHPESLDIELRVTVEAAMELANAVADRPPRDESSERDEAPAGDDDAAQLASALRRILVAHDFVRAQTATDAELAELADRAVVLARLVERLPEGDLADVVEQINQQLQSSAIAPSLSAHDGFALHIHWTGASTPFAHQIAVDVLMALAQTLCDDGLDRFGRCAADGCDRVFYDTTRNHSRRFCADPRCASRTHTAAHRSRRAAAS